MDGIFHGQDSLVQSHQKIFVVQSVMHIYVNTKQNFHSLAYIFCLEMRFPNKNNQNLEKTQTQKLVEMYKN